MDPQLRAQLAETIYVASPSTVDTYGQIAYGAPVAVKARVEFKRSVESGGRGGVLEAREGEQAGTSTFVITESAITITDRIWLPGDDQTDATLARRPLAVLRLPNERGAVDHYETKL